MPTQFDSESDFVVNCLHSYLKKADEKLGLGLNIIPEKRIERGKADLVIEKPGKRFLVIEAKYKKKVGGVEHLIDPREQSVIDQAREYASLGGYPYYATCNPKRLILFKQIPTKPPHESEVASIKIEGNDGWAEHLLKVVLEIVPASLKSVGDTLVELLHEAYEDLREEFHSSLKARLQDESFRARFEKWMLDQGLRLDDPEDVRKIADQTTYLQLNKLLFYNVIRTIYPDKLPGIAIGEEEDVSASLTCYYEKVVNEIDYEPIYQPDLMNEIPFTERAKERFRTLIESLNEYDYSSMESDFLGTVYEKLIPPVERKRLGQFYTPPEIVDLIVKLTVTQKEAKVLDPACGSGSFLVKVYQRLRELNGIPKVMSGPMGELFHRQLLAQVYGTDINQFPAHLSVINLAIQNPKAKVDKINVAVKDFFDLKPRQETLMGFRSMDTEGKQVLIKIPGAFDAIVANPPYIRQELLGDAEKRKIFQLVQEEYKDQLFVGQAKNKKGVVLDRQSDIYIYFYIHSIRFLKQGGMLGYISSNKWLEVGYGEPFQEFLLRNVKILYIIEFDRAVFPDAEVNTAVVILQKEKDEKKREENLARFVRVKKRIDNGELLKLLESEEDIEDERIRVTVVKQGRLKPGKWNVYLRAPPVFKKLMKHPKMKPLGEVAEVLFGLKTGYNDFFILSKEKAEEWGIEPEFLVPCVSSPKKVRGLVIKPEDVDEYFFMCDKPKKDLKGTNALKYIEYGERMEVDVTRGSKKGTKKLPELETVKGRTLWYALPYFNIPDLLLPKLADKRVLCIFNKGKALGSDLFYFMNLNQKSYLYPILALINSSVGALFGELYGRSYGGGVLDLKVYETKRIPILINSDGYDLSKFVHFLFSAVEARIKAEEALESLRSKKKDQPGILEIEAKKRLEEAIEAEKKAQKELDEAVYDILGLTEKERRQVEEGLKELQELRRARTRV
ncbi:MAG: N-6 DNA methylase [Candidatus Methanosuratincola petrocarbonis]